MESLRRRNAPSVYNMGGSSTHHFLLCPDISVKGHVLDEAHVDGLVPRQLHEVCELVVVLSPHKHHVHLRGLRVAVESKCQPLVIIVPHNPDRTTV